MIILTYHTVCPLNRLTRGIDSRFYNITPQEFEEQVLFLREKEYKAIAAEQLIASEAPPKERTVLLTFDDGTEEHYTTVLPILDKYGYKSIFFVPAGKVGKTGYLSVWQLKDMVSRGYIIASHSVTHRYLPDLKASEIKQEVEQSKAMLEDIVGCPVFAFAPPGGGYDKNIRAMCEAGGYKLVRTTRRGYNRKFSCLDLESFTIDRLMVPKGFFAVIEGRGTKMPYFAKEIFKRIFGKQIYFYLRCLIH